MNRVLIIEDEPLMRDLYKSLLEDQFYELTEAENGTQALDMAQETPFDLYITDIMMPKMSGLEFLRELKKIDPSAHVIIVTGYDDISYNRKAIEYGAWRYLVKPVARSEFLNVIRAGLIEHNRLIDPDFAGFDMPAPKAEPEAQAEPEESAGIEPLLKDIAFSKLKLLNAEDALSAYNENADAIFEYVEQPMQNLLHEIARQLPEYMQSLLEIEEKLFEPIKRKQMKKEFAVDYYYGAFYPKGGNRSQDGQLYIAINEDRFEYGFIVGEYGDDQRLVFIGNLRNHKDKLIEDLNDIIKDGAIIKGTLLGKLLDIDEEDLNKAEPILPTPMSSPGGTHACYQIPREKAVTFNQESMVEMVLRGFQTLYPLFVLTTGSDAIEKLNRSSQYIPSQEELEQWLETEVKDDSFPQSQQPKPSVTEFPTLTQAQPEPAPEPAYKENIPASASVVPERRREPVRRIIEHVPVRSETVQESSYLFYQPRFYADEQQPVPEPSKRWKSLLKRRRQVYIRGEADVEMLAENLARAFIQGTEGFRDALVLHPSLKYSDLVRQPKSIYPDGFFPLFFEAAVSIDAPCVLVLNHFDTCDQLEILGEYLYLLQNRGTKLSITRSSEFLVVPENVYVIATGSKEIEETRVRQVFAQIDYQPDYSILLELLPEEKAEEFLNLLNEFFEMQPSLENHVGVVPFLREKDDLEEAMPDIWDIDVLPLAAAMLQNKGVRPSDFTWEKLLETKLKAWT